MSRSFDSFDAVSVLFGMLIPLHLLALYRLVAAAAAIGTAKSSKTLARHGARFGRPFEYFRLALNLKPEASLWYTVALRTFVGRNL